MNNEIQQVIWEENVSTELPNIVPNKLGNECVNIISPTPKKLRKEILLGITHKRNCPSCNKEIIYKYKWTFDVATRENRRCISCNSCGRKLSDSAKKKVSDFNRGKTLSPHTKYLIGASSKGRNIGRKHSNETRHKVSLAGMGRVTSVETKQKISSANSGKHHSDETRRKLRIIRTEWVINNHGGPQYNPTACFYFDTLNRQNNWNLQHANNGGEYYVKELGYWVDAYDKTRNIVIEYDEPRHFDIYGNLKERDVKRMNDIKRLLGCVFMRYNEKTKETTTY